MKGMKVNQESSLNPIILDENLIAIPREIDQDVYHIIDVNSTSWEFAGWMDDVGVEIVPKKIRSYSDRQNTALTKELIDKYAQRINK
jgi:hypothetical protein